MRACFLGPSEYFEQSTKVAPVLLQLNFLSSLWPTLCCFNIFDPQTPVQKTLTPLLNMSWHIKNICKLNVASLPKNGKSDCHKGCANTSARKYSHTQRYTKVVKKSK